MPAAPPIEAMLHLTFAQMHTIYNSSVGKRQRAFLAELFRVLFAPQGRATFTKLARYSPRPEHTFRRHFAKAFNWGAFNLALFRLRSQPVIGVFDTSFLPRSGTKTYGLDRFFSQKANRTESQPHAHRLGGLLAGARRHGEPAR